MPYKSKDARRAYVAGMRSAARIVLGSKCSRCGLTDPRTLQIDHVAGGGRAHRAKMGGSGMNYVRSVLSGLLSGRYRLLCANCHSIVGYHRRKR